jgi:acetate kinase
MREVLARDDPEARLALDVYLHRLAREVAAMTASLGGLDVLVFTGGVGERAPAVRAGVADRLCFLGVAVDPQANTHVGNEVHLAGGPGWRPGEADISAESAAVATVVVAANEALEIAAAVRSVLITESN